MRFPLASLREQTTAFFQAARRVLYGVAAHEIVLYTIRLRAEMESLFILVTLGDLIGVPILPPYYSLRLLPYLVPNIASWKHRVLRERDILDSEGLDLLA